MHSSQEHPRNLSPNNPQQETARSDWGYTDPSSHIPESPFQRQGWAGTSPVPSLLLGNAPGGGDSRGNVLEIFHLSLLPCGREILWVSIIGVLLHEK